MGRRRSKDIRKTLAISLCKCPECGNSFPIPRNTYAQREKGHLKSIWCPFCKKKTNHIESRSFDYPDYKNEYIYIHKSCLGCYGCNEECSICEEKDTCKEETYKLDIAQLMKG